uniref:LysM peptidoglycan-binding domain-containing protein n=1 Tax=Roseateles sp. TaxID=1971397 RepID=UPI0037CC0D25
MKSPLLSAFRLLALVAGIGSASVSLSQAQTDVQDWQYRVQAGDTLLSLSDSLLEPEHGWRDLMRHNRIADPQRLRPGSTLRMPIAWL